MESTLTDIDIMAASGTSYKHWWCLTGESGMASFIAGQQFAGGALLKLFLVGRLFQ